MKPTLKGDKRGKKVNENRMMKKTVLAAMLLVASQGAFNSARAEDGFIGKQTPTFENDLFTAEALWTMGRIGGVKLSEDGERMVYQVTYCSIEQNKLHNVLYIQNASGDLTPTMLTTTNDNELSAQFITGGSKILFLSNHGGSYQLWTMNTDGSERKQISNVEGGVDDYLLSPDETKIILIRQVEDHSTIAANDDDLPLSSGMVINDMMYKHWDRFVTEIPHPFVADFTADGIGELKDILEGEPYECPTLPFGGTEQLAWSSDSKKIAYTCRKKTGKRYALSTDSDIYLYNVETGTTTNLCKSDGYEEPECEATESLEEQAVNRNSQDENVGYDQNPSFSPDGKYVAWLSMERAGYESDRSRLCVYELETGKKTYVTESFKSGVDGFCWAPNSKDLYFAGVWRATTMVYRTNLKGEVEKLTDGVWDYVVVTATPDGKGIIALQHSMSQANEICRVDVKSGDVEMLTEENKYYYDNIEFGKVEEREIETCDGSKEQCWIIYPPHFDATKKYPTLLYCEGGPQSAVSQFWSVRWNFQIMAANGYIIVAPNRRGLPGYGMEWLEEISGDYTGLCMKDYLAAIDEMAKEPYVDEDRLGCVGASFGGFSVYWLAGHHEGRFKCFIAHDGIYNVEQQYVETEEMWFPNWDLGAAPWRTDVEEAQTTYANSPHKSIDKWDSPILCIHGMKDYRILHSQAEAAFNAARLRGIDAQLLLFPDENHWVLKPQNGILWQRTFFRWLEKYLKK